MIYFETQSERLCGVHALNALLQHGAFAPGDLAEIAQALDAKERVLLSEEVATTSSRANEQSENVSRDGNFSVQVLESALAIYGLVMRPITSPKEREMRPDLERGFLCNLSEHWFALRRVDSTWWDLNSIKRAPRKIGEFYLEAFLDQLKGEGWSVFVVRDLEGVPITDEQRGSTTTYGKWFTEEEAITLSAEADAAQASGRTRLAAEKALRAIGEGAKTLVAPDVVDVTGEDDPELKAALEASMNDHRQRNVDITTNDADADLDAAIAASLADAGAGFNDSGDALERAIAASLENVDRVDAATEAAIAASLAEDRTSTKRSFEEDTTPIEDEPDVGEGVVSLAFRLPSGNRMTRRFVDSATVSDLERFIKAKTRLDVTVNCLAVAFPPRALSDASMSLAEAGIADKDVLTVRPR